jgi:hypothetical protein
MEINTNNYMKMETRIISLLTILALNFSISFANTTAIFTEVRPVERTIINLAPVSPVEADFNDVVPEANASNSIIMPVAPKEATFDDDPYQVTVNDEQLLNSLSPSTPEEAGFEDTI